MIAEANTENPLPSEEDGNEKGESEANDATPGSVAPAEVTPNA